MFTCPAPKPTLESVWRLPKRTFFPIFSLRMTELIRATRSGTRLQTAFWRNSLAAFRCCSFEVGPGQTGDLRPLALGDHSPIVPADGESQPCVACDVLIRCGVDQTTGPRACSLRPDLLSWMEPGADGRVFSGRRPYCPTSMQGGPRHAAPGANGRKRCWRPTVMRRCAVREDRR
jgi:hypothetical protein